MFSALIIYFLFVENHVFKVFIEKKVHFKILIIVKNRNIV